MRHNELLLATWLLSLIVLHLTATASSTTTPNNTVVSTATPSGSLTATTGSGSGGIASGGGGIASGSGGIASGGGGGGTGGGAITGNSTSPDSGTVQLYGTASSILLTALGAVTTFYFR